MSRPTLAEAQARYVHRFTMEHVPEWAQKQRVDGTFYAPQYRSDQEWYENTRFPGEPGNPWKSSDWVCYSLNQTFPLGQWLTKVYSK